jgi:signal recognition particle subunit SEC65
MFLLTLDQHRTVAKDLRQQVNDPKAQELATAHEKLAVAIQKHLDDQVPRLAPQSRLYVARRSRRETHVDRC